MEPCLLSAKQIGKLSGIRSMDDLHTVNVVLLGVGTSKEEPLCRGDLIWTVDIHAWSFAIQRLADLDDRLPRVLQSLCRWEQFPHLHICFRFA